MARRVTLKEVVEALELQGDFMVAYLNRETGKIVYVSEDDTAALEGDPENLPEWQRENLPAVREALESDDYLQLPDSFEIHEWAMMADFCNSVSDSQRRGELLDAIHGRGAFRFFRRTLERFKLRDEWYRFREKALERKAKEWLEVNQIPYD